METFDIGIDLHLLNSASFQILERNFGLKLYPLSDHHGPVVIKIQSLSLFKNNFSQYFRSLDGNGSFNWRMVFPFEYLPIDKKIVIKEEVSIVVSSINLLCISLSLN